MFSEAAEGNGYATHTILLVSWALMTKKEEGGLPYLAPGFITVLLSERVILFKLDIYVHIHVSLCILQHSVFLIFSSFLSLPPLPS